MTTKESPVQQTVTLLRNRGKEALEIAKQSIQQETAEHKPLEEALNYFVETVFPDILQPGLLSLYCEAVGGKANQTTMVGAAMVLLVGAAELHDDVIDGSASKGSKPTVLGKFGKDVALLAGDAFLIKGMNLLNQSISGFPEKKAATISNLVEQAFFDLSNAEAEEASHGGKNDLSGEEYFGIIKKKVAVSEATARIGAILANSTGDEIELLGELGRVLGLLNTLRDEFIDVFEPQELANRYKKEVLPLPVLLVFKDPKKRKEILDLLENGRITERKTNKIASIVIAAKETEELRCIMRLEIHEATQKVERFKKFGETFRLLLNSSLEDLQ